MNPATRRLSVWTIAFAATATIVSAQTGTEPPADQESATSTPATPAGQPARLDVRVTDAAGAPRPGAVIRLRREGEADLLQLTDARGQSTFTGLSPGEYVLQLVSAGAVAPGEQVALSPGDAASRALTVPAASAGSAQPVIWGAIAYLVAILGFRLFTIAQPARKLLYAEIESVALKLHMEGGSATKVELERLVAEIDDVRKSQEWSTVEYVREPLFWSGGRELSAWRRIHEVERHLAIFLAPSERVFQRAVTLASHLSNLGTATGTFLGDRLRATIDQPPESRSTQLLRHQISEGLTCAYNEQDNKFAALMEWHNKAMWMVTLALMAIVSLSLMFDRSQLFFIGGVGGLMSRMMRSLHREDVPTDYGASWTTLFLSPLLGSIAAWFGIAGIDMLGDMQVLGSVLATIEWDMPATNALTMFTAFLLGFSERLFMSLLSKAEGRIDSEVKRGSASQPSSPRAATVQAAAAAAVQAGAGRTDKPAPLAAPSSAAVLEDLDLAPGEHAIFVGDPTSPLRLQLLGLAGAGNVRDLPLEKLAGAGPVDAILIDRLPDAAGLHAAAAACAQALRPDGRVVAVGSTPAEVYEADAATQAQQNVVGPALLHERMTAAGLMAQEPPEAHEGPDPVRWSAAFKNP